MDLIYPSCGEKLEQKFGLPALLLVCKCGKEWVKFLNKLVERKEFHNQVDEWHN